jgi:demethylmenaquinone methyltransferase/2-methoxy-6-polyprenyl-1,4-benzoquinol methylase
MTTSSGAKGSGALVEGQIEYYRARAPEYDEWFLRTGRYARDAAWEARWNAEIDEVRSSLHDACPLGRTLELACGTGLWTEWLLPHAEALTAVDASPEVIELNRARISALDAAAADRVRFIVADLFSWPGDGRYDFVFFGFWLSHIPPERFDEFWELVSRCLAPGGRVFFVDNQQDSGSGAQAPKPRHAGDAACVQKRRLNDGREFDVVKVFHEPTELEARMRGLGWEIDVHATPEFFIHGSGSRG